jgi:hypothetical protein
MFFAWNLKAMWSVHFYREQLNYAQVMGKPYLHEKSTGGIEIELPYTVLKKKKIIQESHPKEKRYKILHRMKPAIQTSERSVRMQKPDGFH